MFRKLLSKLVPHSFDRQALKNRVAMLPPDDPLWPLLLGLLAENLRIEVQMLARPAIGDEEAHRARGRAGMIMDLQSQLEDLWKDTHRDTKP